MNLMREAFRQTGGDEVITIKLNRKDVEDLQKQNPSKFKRIVDIVDAVLGRKKPPPPPPPPPPLPPPPPPLPPPPLLRPPPLHRPPLPLHGLTHSNAAVHSASASAYNSVITASPFFAPLCAAA